MKIIGESIALRRGLLRFARAACIFALSLLFLLAVGRAQNFVDIKPSPQQVEWQDLEFGVIIHFGTNTYLDREWGDGTASPQLFNPTELDAEQWMRAIKAAGADGLLIEVHPNPALALSDGPQQLRPDHFAQLVAAVRPVAEAVGRAL